MTANPGPFLARHRLATGELVEARTRSFVAKWNGKSVVFTVNDAGDAMEKRSRMGGRRLRDKLGRQVDVARVDSFLACHSDIPFLDELLDIDYSPGRTGEILEGGPLLRVRRDFPKRRISFFAGCSGNIR
jgi:hypothetical protein